MPRSIAAMDRDDLAKLLADPEFLRFVAEKATPEERAKFGPALQVAVEQWKYTWENHARPEQLAPDGDWNTWLIMSGRGWGKTRTGAEWVKKQALSHPGTRWAVVGPTFKAVDSVCFEGESGLKYLLPQSALREGSWSKAYNSSDIELFLANGSIITGYYAEKPDNLRGPQHHGAWCDELAAWRYADTWDQLQLGLRLGKHPRVVVTTTPRPVPLVKDLVKLDDTHVTRGSTFDNKDNLSETALKKYREQYEGSRLGRQELYGELLLDTPGALWTYDVIEQNRVFEAPDLQRISVNVDPSGGAGENHDLQGITVTGRGVDGHGYVLADRSCSLSPAGWGARAVGAYVEFSADVIVIEKNFGGDMAEATIKQAARDMGVTVNVKAVTSSRGKVLRAEPVAALYEQNRFHHAGSFPELEDQLTSWTPQDGKSPDRLDALVFGATELMLAKTSPTRLKFRGR